MIEKNCSNCYHCNWDTFTYTCSRLGMCLSYRDGVCDHWRDGRSWFKRVFGDEEMRKARANYRRG